jgi:hypothetical protein
MRWLLLLASCAAQLVDPCAGNGGTCVALYVDASPPIDALDIRVTGPSWQQSKNSPSPGGKFSPPIAVALLFDNSLIDPSGSQLTFDVTGKSGSDAVAGATTSALVKRSSRTEVHVRLASAIPDLAVVNDLTAAIPIDLSVAADLPVIPVFNDLSSFDLTPPPMCTASSGCPVSFPICDPNTLMCRVCSGASEDATCLQRSAATPHCRLSGTNAGLCVACNLNADCPMATPVCNPDGTCRPCQAHAECASGVCDKSSGTCAAGSDTIYVDASNDPGQASCSDTGKDGTIAKPYCDIASALTLLGTTTRHYVHLAPSGNNYTGFELQDTQGRTYTFVGPGKDAPVKATIQAAVNMIAINIDPTASGQSVSLVLDGVTVIGNGTANLLVCNASVTTTGALTITDSSFSTGNSNGVVMNNMCSLNLSRSYISGVTNTGLYLNSLSTFVVQNVFIWGNGQGVDFESTSGVFNFNTVAYNSNNQGIRIGNSSITIADSIIFANRMSGGTQFVLGGGSSLTLINVVTGTDSIVSAGKIALSPALKSMTDLHLDTSGSNLAVNQACCIDQIVAAGPAPSPSPLPALDIDGSMRPKGAHWDIGAHEAM